MHIHQGEVKEIANPENPEKLDGEIKNLLKLPASSEIQSEFSDSVIEKLINEIFDIKDWLRYKDENGNFQNSLEYNIAKKKKKEDLIGTITTNENKLLIQNYIQNLNKINSVQEHRVNSKSLIDELSEYQAQRNIEIAKINEIIAVVTDNIPLVDFTLQIRALQKFHERMEADISDFEVANKKIEESFKEAGIKEDISTLLEQIEIYQQDINILDRNIIDIKKKQQELNQKLFEIGDIVNGIESSQQTYIENIEMKWILLKQGKESWNSEQKELIIELLSEIDIQAEKKFDRDSFFDLISSNCLNLQKFRGTQSQSRNERLFETFHIVDETDFIRLFKGDQITTLNDRQIDIAELLDSDLFIRDGAREFLRMCLISRYREQFWKVMSSSKYKGKEIHQLSVGQRGTFYVCLKLATDPFAKPFVFDQPEDDLDNDFIMHHLVPIFKKIKKYRQVIIVTHNANLVVNADAEQVIVAANDDEALTYNSGAIENIAIRDEICNILEGGKDAFTKREQKYGFVRI
ncbi:MAG: hypothetical protein K9H64_08590 [Bacteroidales bacterium]|nr:hypothetical protein [Bacteroidales bacterium]MCF8455889.1 hypothetical protein [Bacteroidales bacterium]